ncbi:protein Aster-A isoform X2 [Bufo gargarizans]|uniref:protein Aster-A isoform X2 n=1 Tax=Bufo gargarizans TaxID=30331 RepID=UPI001CF44A00|nr:protein Aster-A isoform X2 [Bufo gargarizans]
METIRQLTPPELWSCSSTPSARRRRLKLKKGQWLVESCAGSETEGTPVRGKALTPPAIEVTPSSEDDAWSNCSTPSASPKRRRGLLKKWLSRKDGGGCSGSITPRSTPSNSPATRKRLTGIEPENMVEKVSENLFEKTQSAQSPTSPPPGAVPTALQSIAQLPNSQPGTPLPPQLSGRASIWNSKIQSFYSMLSPNYKQRNEDFRKIFKKLPDSERLIVDYSCALQRDILLQGRLYLSENWICFHSNIFRWETTITIQLKDIRCIKKEKTAKVIPNAIQVCTENEKHFFTSFGARDRSFLLIFRLWQNALLDKTLSPQELWHTVHQCYGTELGLTSEDEDYVSPRELLNGLGVSEEYPEGPDLSDTSTRSSPKLPIIDSFTSLTSSGEGLLTPEDMAGQSDALSDSQLDGSSSQTVTPLSEMAGSGLLDSLPALDLLPGEELPTDQSNNSSSSSTQDEEAICLGKDALTSDLPGRLHINTVYHLSAERMQQALTADIRFITEFLQERKFTDIVVNPWVPDSSGKQSRIITYTIPINNPLGPKTANVVETQMLTYSLKGSLCILDSQVVTHGIPYQDYFYTAHRYCMTSVTKNKARLRVSSEICYRKQPWSLVRSIIEKNSWNGMDEHFRQLADTMVKFEQSCVEELGVREKPTLRRRKRTLSWKNHLVDPLNTVSPPLDSVRATRHSRTSGSISSQLSHLSDRGTSQNIPTALFIISIVLLVLVVLNMMLFYRLWSLEHTARTFQTWQSYAVSQGRFPQTSAEWAEILELQKRFHSTEVQKWKQTLRTSVQLLDEMRSSLQRLQQGVLLNDATTTATQEEDALS